MTVIQRGGKYRTSKVLSRKDSRELTRDIEILEQRERLLADLRSLNQKYSELLSKAEFVDKGRLKTLKESGQLIIDFYRRTFRPQYLQYCSNRFFNDAGSLLESASIMASKAIKEEGYFSLATLFIPRGSVEGDPNDLEDLIKRLSKRV